MSGWPALADGTPLTLSGIVTRARDVGVAEIGVSEPGAILAAAAGVERLPVGCGTSLVRFLASGDAALPAALQRAGLALSRPPVLSSPAAFATSDRRFLIRYSTSDATAAGLDRDRNGVPDGIDRLAEALVAARSFLEVRLGVPASGPGRLEVYVTEVGAGVEGYVAEEAAGGAGDRFIVLDSALQSDRLLPAALHQVAHAGLAALAPRAETWWSEAAASFLTVAATGDLRPHDAGLRARAEAAGRSLVTDDLVLMQGSLLWPMFLSERSDPLVLRRIQEAIASGTDALRAAERAVGRSVGLDGLAREFAVWNLFTGDRDDRLHYALASSLPRAPLLALSGPPVHLAPVEPVEALGSIAVRLPGDRRRGVLDLEIVAQGGRPAADLLVRFEGGVERPMLVPVALDNGAGRVALPWTEVRDLEIVLRNDAPPPAGPARFEVHGTFDTSAPFDLAGFGAGISGAAIVLEWTTASERGLVGWNVERGERSEGPYTRINTVALPAYGDGTADTGYVFVDETVRPATRYYYRLEGITTAGLVERSHPVSARSAAF